MLSPRLARWARALVTSIFAVALAVAASFVVTRSSASAGTAATSTTISRNQFIGYSSSRKTLETHTAGGRSVVLQVRPTGNLAFYLGGALAWQSGTNSSKARLVVTAAGDVQIKEDNKILRSWGRRDVQSVQVRGDGTFVAINTNGTVVWKASAAPAAKKAQAAPSTSSSSDASAVLGMINAERKAHGLTAVTMSAGLNKAAHAHNLAMAGANTMSHQLAGEPELGDRLDAVGYNWSTAGENIGWNATMNTAGARYLQQVMYEEGPCTAGKSAGACTDGKVHGHYENIVNGGFKNVGVDVYYDQNHKKLWLTTDFGTLR